MVITIVRVVFHIVVFFLSLNFYPAATANMIRVGYWYLEDDISSADINATLFTHLICLSADVNSTTYQPFLSPYGEKQYFKEIVKKMKPSVTALLAIGAPTVNYSTLSSMTSNASYRKSFIDSSINLARVFGFQGLDFSWEFPKSSSDLSNLGILFHEWRDAIELEAKKSDQSQLILTARVGAWPRVGYLYYPVQSMQRNLDWVHILSFGYQTSSNITSAHAALFDSDSSRNTDYGIREWVNKGVSANKLVLGLPFFGYAWTLVNPDKDSGIGAAATGTIQLMTYRKIKNYIKRYGRSIEVMYDSTYVANYCLIGKTWIGFDDVEAIKAKISYAKENRLLGYYVMSIFYDDNWVLSQAAADQANDNKNGRHSKRRVLAIISTTATALIALLGFSIYYFWMRKLKFKGIDLVNYKQTEARANEAAAAEDLSTNVPNLVEYTYSDLEAATNRFSNENKLGEGGFGPVYKGILPDGQVVAVKKLSKTSKQGFEEFKNEVTLTAKLQHVNLVRVLGFCIDREEHILIYEYMPKKSLDYYIFHPIRKSTLNWEERVHIIKGVIQGLLYLQVYSRFTIIHRDLKAANILLDKDMKPKISDFGMAKTFIEEDFEVNTERIVGTFGYIPPEYAKKGIYSTKSDVYSFGVLLLQIISGLRISILCGPNENLSLLDYGYILWKDHKGLEFMDPSLDDTNSTCKLMRCLQIALLCVQKNPNDRPSMLKVSSMLNNETANIDTPSKPGFSKQDDPSESTLQPAACSVNNVTISYMAPR